MLLHSKKIALLNRVNQAKKLRAINSELSKVAMLLLGGDTDFDLIYLSGREKYVGLKLNEELGKKSGVILLTNKCKDQFLQLRKYKRI